jgi:lipopolysaccharide biosynthesis glycosyltransferase
MKETIRIACASDDGYVPHCAALLASIFENNRNNSVEINILTEGIASHNVTRLKSIGEKYGQVVNIVKIPLNCFDGFPIGKRFEGYINRSTYYRLLMPSLFKNYDKILYLDCDIIVVSDLLTLWNTAIDGYAIAGVKDSINNQISGPCRLGYDPKDAYFNAGVGLWNLKYLRSINFDEKVKDYLKENYNRILFHDQDILNALLHGRYYELSIKWNLMGIFLRGADYVRLKEEWLDDMKKPCIIHFADTLKPWFKECDNPYKDLYWRYLRITPWVYYKATFKYPFVRRMKFYTKKFLKSILRICGVKRYSKFKK